MLSKLFGAKQTPEFNAREAIRQKKWAKAIEYYEAKARDSERDSALWNFVGDLHLNNGSRAQAIEAWRRAIDGYATEGMHENVVGISKKVLRSAPEEEDLHLQQATAFLGLEYPADCLASVRSYVKLARQKSESELRTMFRKILDSDMQHPHLLDELHSLYDDSGVDDIELKNRVMQYLESKQKRRGQDSVSAKDSVSVGMTDDLSAPDDTPSTVSTTSSFGDSEAGGLFTLDAPDDGASEEAFRPRPTWNAPAEPSSEPFKMPSEELDNRWDTSSSIPEGEGKDHYELGAVYREMKLWDAAIREFDLARRDPSLRVRSALALAGCLQESGDLQGAYNLLESEKDTRFGSQSERIGLHYQLGIIHELLGNLDQALREFEYVQEQNSGHEDAGQRVQTLSRRLGKTSR